MYIMAAEEKLLIKSLQLISPSVLVQLKKLKTRRKGYSENLFSCSVSSSSSEEEATAAAVAAAAAKASSSYRQLQQQQRLKAPKHGRVLVRVGGDAHEHDDHDDER